jgi:hypothetical protein
VSCGATFTPADDSARGESLWVQIDQATENAEKLIGSVRQMGDQQGIYGLSNLIAPWRSPDADPSTYGQG